MECPPPVRCTAPVLSRRSVPQQALQRASDRGSLIVRRMASAGRRGRRRACTPSTSMRSRRVRAARCSESEALAGREASEVSPSGHWWRCPRRFHRRHPRRSEGSQPPARCRRPRGHRRLCLGRFKAGQRASAVGAQRLMLDPAHAVRLSRAEAWRGLSSSVAHTASGTPLHWGPSLDRCGASPVTALARPSGADPGRPRMSR